MKLKIFTLTHKEITSPKFDSSYMVPLYNSDCHNDMDSFNDKCMYETYMIYDVYKNQKKYFDKDTEYIGFCHYRRYFDVDYDYIISVLKQQKSILNKTYMGFSVLHQFNTSHDTTNTDFKIIKMILEDKYPEYVDDLNSFLNGQTISLHNMFITNIKIFNEYCSWVFDIVKEYFKFYNINNYGDMYKFVIDHVYKYPRILYNNRDRLYSIEYQSRIGGFLAERLINVFFLHNYKNNIQYIKAIQVE